jgi:hypothetical protein
MSRWDIQFTARKRQPWDGEPYRWRHGHFTSLEDAIAYERSLRELRKKNGVGPTTRIEIIKMGVRKVRSKGVARKDHAARTRAGMAAARAAGKRIGRPRVKFLAANERVALIIARGQMKQHGKAEGLRMAAKHLRVSVSTLKRALAKEGR